MFSCLRLIFFASLGLACYPINLFASLDDYIYPSLKSPSYSNYGSIGLIQNPNARFNSEGTLGFTWSHNEPYLRGSIMAYPFDWLEASFQYTDLNNRLYSQVKEFSGNQSLKDKSFDTKIRLRKETALIPQVAIGVRDIGGTGLFGSEYLVMSKKFGPNFDISLGVGWGHLNGNKISNPLSSLSSSFERRNSTQGEGGKVNFKDFFSGDAGYFGGIEYVIPFRRGIRLKFELDGTNYRTETNIPLEQDSKFNFGIVYPWTKNFHTKISYARGNTLNFGFSYSLGLGKKNPLNQKKFKRADLPNKDAIRFVTQKSDSNLFKASLLYLQRDQISLQKASIKDDEYHVVIAQAAYRSPALSAGRAFRIIDEISPDKIKKITVSEVNGGIGMYTASVSRETLKRYEYHSSPQVLNKYIHTEPFYFKDENYDFNPLVKYPAVFNTMGPELVSQIGGPDGFFFGDLKWNFDSEIIFSRNLSLISSFKYGLIDNMDDLKLPSDSILPHVRTDIVKYLRQSRNLSIQRLQANYFGQLSPSLYYKISGGILESMFTGIGGEVLYRPYSKNFGIGLEAWAVNQRDYDQMFALRDYKTTTGHITWYYQEPSTNILFRLIGGKYLAKDSGFTFDFSRIFRSGLRMGAFFSLTDISDEEFGEGSFDKGFYFWIPVDLFSNRHLKKSFGWGLRPVTRDGAQAVIHSHPLWGVVDSASNHKFRRNIDDIYD